MRWWVGNAALSSEDGVLHEFFKKHCPQREFARIQRLVPRHSHVDSHRRAACLSTGVPAVSPMVLEGARAAPSDDWLSKRRSL